MTLFKRNSTKAGYIRRIILCCIGVMVVILGIAYCVHSDISLNDPTRVETTSEMFTITHMDISSNGTCSGCDYFITMVNDTTAITLETRTETYARHQVGDEISAKVTREYAADGYLIRTTVHADGCWTNTIEDYRKVHILPSAAIYSAEVTP